MAQLKFSNSNSSIASCLIIFLPLFIALQTQAQNLKSQDYVEINETITRPSSPLLTFDPSELLSPMVQALRAASINILNWTYKHSEENQGLPYMRIEHFGAWINDPTDDTCYNTRGKVLQRDSQVPVGVSEQNRCKVQNGRWLDPYTKKTMHTAEELQIDHVVPLKNTYISGGYRWTRSERCHYANYMGNRYHLLPVSSFENMSKGDRSPGDYLPPTLSYRCDYIKTWLKIKLIWGLNMSLEESRGIQEELKIHKCSLRGFSMSARELLEQRSIIAKTDYYCRN